MHLPSQPLRANAVKHPSGERARCVHPTPLGPMQLVADEAGLQTAVFLDDAVPDPAERSPILDQARTELDAYFAGTLMPFATPLSLAGTPFQRRVWAVLTTLPYGRTTTYGAIAATLGDPRCVRAVGTANGANPVALFVPCHRVIGGDGSLVGYAGGIERKAALLRLEGVGNPLFR